MKAKIGNIECEGTPEEIKDFIINNPEGKTAKSGASPVSLDNSTKQELNNEISKDYDSLKCYLCHTSNGAGMWNALDIGDVWICSRCDRKNIFTNAHRKFALSEKDDGGKDVK